MELVFFVCAKHMSIWQVFCQGCVCARACVWACPLAQSHK